MYTPFGKETYLYWYEIMLLLRRFEEKAGQLAIDQIRSVDKTRLIKKLGTLEEEVSMLLCRVLVETFKF